MSTKPFLYGKYVILNRIAVGGMAEVFRAKTFGVHGFQRLLVIKRILPHLSKDDEFVDMFIDEAKIAVSLTHANICQITDLGKIDDNYFIAMEYVNGKDLRAILKKCYSQKKTLDIEQSIYIISEVCKGLEYAHRREDPMTGELMSVIHRDISPQNIMISYHGEVKIVDFGIAKTEHKIHRTQAGVLKGKFAYMSPEQSMGQELTVQTDIFSAGIILFEMLTNQRLFLGSTDFETLENIKRCEVPSISKINPAVSAQLQAVVEKALSKSPLDRFSSANLMHNALSKILYTEFPHFTPDHLSKRLFNMFEDEIKQESDTLKKALAEIGIDQMDLAQKASEAEISVSNVQNKPSSSYHFKKPGFLQRFKYPMLFLGLILMTVAIGKIFFPKKVSKKTKDETSQTYTPQENLSLATPPSAPKTPDSSSTKAQPPAENIPVFGALKIDTTPSGASIFINGVDSNQTSPATIDELPFEKEAEVSLEKDGYKTQVRRIMISKSSQDLHVDLKRKGPTLRINTTPSDATIYLNKKTYSNVITDLSNDETYTLRIESKGYMPEERKVKIEGDQLELDIELKKKETQLGEISISATPWATILVDGKVIGTSPVLNLPLTVGKHEVIFRHPDFPDIQKNVNIKYNDSQKLIIDLRQESQK